jgi:dTMP kinase
MIKNRYGGLLVAFDGPKGAGKSTLVKQIENTLFQKGIDVWATKEPSNTPFGEFIRPFSEEIESEGLACIIAAHRYYQLKNAIIPRLKNNCVVLTDRYILSSLILQRMDGVDARFIFNINEKIIMPDIQVAIYASEDILKERIGKREWLTRFEKGNRTFEELRYLKEGEYMLHDFEIDIINLDNSDNLSENILFIAERICEKLRCKR